MIKEFYLLHVDQQGFFVVFPLSGQFTGMREFITGQLYSHLEAVSVQVAEVIHTWEQAQDFELTDCTLTVPVVL